MLEGMLHIRDVEGPKKTGNMETRLEAMELEAMELEAMEQQVFKCKGMVERGLNANHMMITEFTNKQMIDANDIGKHLSRLYDRIDQLQSQIYDLQNQNCEETIMDEGNNLHVCEVTNPDHSHMDVEFNLGAETSRYRWKTGMPPPPSKKSRECEAYNTDLDDMPEFDAMIADF
ncbi:hypothetical protein D1007_59108 [Hordeum vulgare]|nr:hypothetical protein D1007_59108 [Hordeum vulgare]